MSVSFTNLPEYYKGYIPTLLNYSADAWNAYYEPKPETLLSVWKKWMKEEKGINVDYYIQIQGYMNA